MLAPGWPESTASNRRALCFLVFFFSHFLARSLSLSSLSHSPHVAQPLPRWSGTRSSALVVIARPTYTISVRARGDAPNDRLESRLESRLADRDAEGGGRLYKLRDDTINGIESISIMTHTHTHFSIAKRCCGVGTWFLLHDKLLSYTALLWGGEHTPGHHHLLMGLFFLF